MTTAAWTHGNPDICQPLHEHVDWPRLTTTLGLEKTSQINSDDGLATQALPFSINYRIILSTFLHNDVDHAVVFSRLSFNWFISKICIESIKFVTGSTHLFLISEFQDSHPFDVICPNLRPSKYALDHFSRGRSTMKLLNLWPPVTNSIAKQRSNSSVVEAYTQSTNCFKTFSRSSLDAPLNLSFKLAVRCL